MRKTKKTRKGRKKPLDALSGTKPHGRRKPPNKPAVTSPLHNVAGPIDYEFPLFSPVSPYQMAEPEKQKMGRPTIPNNFLLGARNNWVLELEENWAEIGFLLLEIRQKKNGTIEDVQKAFELLKGTDTGAVFKVFLRGTPQQVTGNDLRANRILNSKLHFKIQEMYSQCSLLTHSCAVAEEALKQSGEEERDIIWKEACVRKDDLVRFEERLKRTEKESEELDQKVRDQETYWYCSQLLDFLCGKRKNAVNPLNLANSLAGLPEMGWRESYARCSKSQREPVVRLPYRVFEVTCRVWRRRPKDEQEPPTDFFRAHILKLPKKDDGIREALGRKWRDLRLAIEECWQERHSEEFMPFAITSVFNRNSLRSKTLAEQILDESEMLFKREGQLGVVS